MMKVIDMHRPGDGRQELTLVLRNPVKPFVDLFRDPRAKGHEHFLQKNTRMSKMNESSTIQMVPCHINKHRLRQVLE
mgnify:CR=1 FL=1